MFKLWVHGTVSCRGMWFTLRVFLLNIFDHFDRQVRFYGMMDLSNRAVTVNAKPFLSDP